MDYQQRIEELEVMLEQRDKAIEQLHLIHDAILDMSGSRLKRLATINEGLITRIEMLQYKNFMPSVLTKYNKGDTNG